MMPLDNGAADRQADAHAIVLCRVESVEQPVGVLRREAHPRVLHQNAYVVAVILLSPDQQSPWSIINTTHRVRGILEEIQDHLLKLDPITHDRREYTGKLRFQYHSIPMKVTQRQGKYLARGLVQIQRFSRRPPLAEECAQSLDDIRCTVAIADRALRRFACTFDIWRIGREHPQASAGIGYDA